jgi:hypothetical protein
VNIGTGILSWLLLALLALTSAILCIAPPSLGGWLGVLYVGTVYGLLLGVYFVTCRGIRSAPRLITLVVVSAVAWPIAYFGSFFAPGTFREGQFITATLSILRFLLLLSGVCWVVLRC